MAKKLILFFIVVLILVGGGFFYWRDQTDVRKLNKNLPESVRVVKSLFSNEYKVVNKIDGYEFKVPDDWRGVSKIKYENVIDTKSSIKEGIKDFDKNIILESHLLIDGLRPLDGLEIRFIKFSNSIDLTTFVEQFQDTYVPYKKTERLEMIPKIDDFNISDLNGQKLYTLSKFQTGSELISDEHYFFSKEDKLYIILHFNDEFIKQFITNGKW